MCRAYSSNKTTASGFLLCMLSPVWRAKLCGWKGNTDQTIRELQLEEGDAPLFAPLLDVCLSTIGSTVLQNAELDELMALGRLADRYQVRVPRALRKPSARTFVSSVLGQSQC